MKKVLVFQRDLKNPCSLPLTVLLSEVYALRKFLSVLLTTMGAYCSCSVVACSDNELRLCLGVFCLCSEDPLPVHPLGTGCPWEEPLLALPSAQMGFGAELKVLPVSH